NKSTCKTFRELVNQLQRHGCCGNQVLDAALPGTDLPIKAARCQIKAAANGQVDADALLRGQVRGGMCPVLAWRAVGAGQLFGTGQHKGGSYHTLYIKPVGEVPGAGYVPHSGIVAAGFVVTQTGSKTGP